MVFRHRHLSLRPLVVFRKGKLDHIFILQHILQPALEHYERDCFPLFVLLR